EIFKDVKENNISIEINVEDDLLGNITKSPIGKSKSTMNDLIISKSLQVKESKDLEEEKLKSDLFGKSKEFKHSNLEDKMEIKDINDIKDKTQNKGDNTVIPRSTQTQNTKILTQNLNKLGELYKNLNNNTINDLKLRSIIQESSIIRTSCFNQDGDFLAIGTNSKSVKIFEMKSLLQSISPKGIKRNIQSEKTNLISPQLIFEQKNHHLGSIYCLDWSVSGRLLASGSNDKSIKLMVVPDLFSIIEQNKPKVSKNYDNSLSDDSEEGDDEDILELPITGLKGAVRSVLFDPISDLILYSSCSIDSSIKIWDTEKGENKGELLGHIGDVNSLVWSHDGSYFASSGEDKTIRFWDLKSNKTSALIDAGRFSSINDISLTNSFSNSVLVAAAHSNGKISIWDFGRKTLVKEIKNSSIFNGPCDVRAVDFSKNGKYLVSGSFDGKVKVYDVMNDFNLVKEFSHDDKVVSAKWHKKYPLIVSTSSDKSVRIWSLESI
ncbi:MAG: WD40 repeat domain-containing protein, partial [archaeon]|nr:WD40 repeat domain-containing protein [archaeon]